MKELPRNSQLVRENYIDVIKGIGIILVIVGHSEVSVNVRKIIYEFHMPLFFLLAGYVFQYEKWSSRSIREFCKVKWKAYINKYFIFATVNLLIVGGIWGVIKYGISLEWIKLNLHYIFWILYSKGSVLTMPECTPLWFLTCIFITNIMFFCLMRVGNKARTIITIVLGIVGWILYKIQMPKLPWNVDTALTGIVFMECGYVIKKYNVIEKINLWRAVLLLIMGSISICLTGYVDMGSNQLGIVGWFYLGAISLDMLIILVSKEILQKNKMLAMYGRHTILVLGFNYMIKDIYAIVINNVFDEYSYILNSWYMSSLIVVLCFGMIMIWKEKYKNVEI